MENQGDVTPAIIEENKVEPTCNAYVPVLLVQNSENWNKYVI